VMFEHGFPDRQRGVFLPELRQGLGISHEGVTVIMTRILAGNAFQERGGFFTLPWRRRHWPRCA
jgi:hypothetical protein